MENKEINLEYLGGLFFSREEAMIIMDSDGTADPWLKGKLMRAAKLRESIFDMAESGSSVAQEVAIKLFSDLNLKEIEERHG